MQILVDDLGVATGDVRHLIAELVDLYEDELPPEIAAEVRRILEPHSERTAPELYGATGDDVTADWPPRPGPGPAR